MFYLVPTALCLKDCGNPTWQMEAEEWFTMTVIFTRESGLMIRTTGTGTIINKRMASILREPGSKTHNLALGTRSGPTRLLILDNITMARSRARELCAGLTALSMRVTSKIIIYMDKGRINGATEEATLVDGT